VLFRESLPADDGHRPAFLGHILTEILLDAMLIERYPQQLVAYYAALAQVDAAVIENSANRMARHATDRLKVFIPLFTRERFLPDYLDSKRLLYRLNQIMYRVRLNPLPSGFEASLDEARSIVRGHAAGLLPGNLMQLKS